MFFQHLRRMASIFFCTTHFMDSQNIYDNKNNLVLTSHEFYHQIDKTFFFYFIINIAVIHLSYEVHDLYKLFFCKKVFCV